MAVNKKKGHYEVKILHFVGSDVIHSIEPGWVPFATIISEEGHGSEYWVTVRRWVA